MACFIVPATEAIIVTVVSKTLEKRLKTQDNDSDVAGYTTAQSFLKKRKWLTSLLWGGSALLTFEHIWHGEIVPWFPFLTAAYSAEDTIAMLHEMASVGVMMALVVTVVWIGMVLISNALEKRSVHGLKNQEDL